MPILVRTGRAYPRSVQPPSVHDQLREALGDVPELLPADPNAEARLNTRSVSRATDEPVDAGAISSLLAEIADTWLCRCQAPATFYAWYDAQAGQLRFSVTSSEPTDLPFGADVRLLPDSTEVVGAFADDPSPGVIKWDDLSDVSGVDVGHAASPVLPVWAVRLPNRV